MPTSHAIASLKEKLDNDATGKLAKKVAELRKRVKDYYVQTEDMALLFGVSYSRFKLHCMLLVQDGDLDAVSLPGGMGTLDGYEVREIEGSKAHGWTKPAGYKVILSRWFKVPIADEASQTAQQAEATRRASAAEDDEDADDDEDEVVEVEEEDEEDDDEEEEEDEEDEDDEEEDEEEEESAQWEAQWSDEEDEDEDESEESESDEESQDDDEDEEEDDSQEENDKSEEEEEVQVSAYEQMRRANIERNNEALARLDVKAVVAKLVSKKKAPKRKRPVEATLPMAPTRTSSRGTKAPGFYAEPEVEQLA
jgi:hypothetical protein